MDNKDPFLSSDQIIEIVKNALIQWKLQDKNVLVLTPDHTRTAPLPLLFKVITETLSPIVRRLDYLVALGTHPIMSDAKLHELFGIDEIVPENVGILNHHWSDPNQLVTLGEITREQTEYYTDGQLSLNVPVTINKKILEYDHIIILGPVFPHEVAGFSGGYKYFFPGISGPDVIHFTHWVGALNTSFATIGVQDTAVREVINIAANMVPTPTKAICLVTSKDGVYGTFTGDVKKAWTDACELSSQVHVRYFDKPFKKVISVLAPLYDELWTGAKGMYKVEPVIADGGEVIILAPQLDVISHTHGKYIETIGYHIKEYFVERWDQFKHYPWGILAHSTHLKGLGRMENGVEIPRIQVTLATGIPEHICKQVNLGYQDPRDFDIQNFRNREDEGILVVPYAGEILHRLKG